MNNRFEFETFDEQPFEFEEEDEARSGRRRSMPRRKSSSVSKLVPRKKFPLKPRPFPGIKFPSRFPIRPLPFPVWPGVPTEPSQTTEPPKDSGSSGSTPSTPPDNDTPREGSEYIRWVQASLNQLLKLSLRTDGIIDADTRDAIRSFQRREKLPVTGVIGPDTQQALVVATRNQHDQADQSGQQGEVADRRQRVPITLGVAGDPRIIDLTAKADKRNRLQIRDPKKVHALVLHQMACCHRVANPLTRFLEMAPHFAILPDGRILQLHPLQALTPASNGFNAGSVAVEFAGNFPNIKGKWWISKKEIAKLKEKLAALPEAQIKARINAYIKANQNQVTPQQIESGRYLVRYLIRTMGLRTIFAHRQSSKDRENDPGPDIWYHVGQWAIDNLGLKNGPPFKVGTGNPIPDLWRKWGQAKPQPELEFSSYEFDGYGELEFEDELSFGSPLRAARKVNPKFVSCQPPSAAIKAITGADPVGTIQKANTRAIQLLDEVINQLQNTRKKIIAGAAASSPTVSATVSNALKKRFSMTASNRAIWTKQGSGTVDLLIRRFRGARQILADGWMKYTCLGTPAPATVTIHRGGTACTVEGCAGEEAFTCGGNSHIVLCRPWWEEDLGVNKLDAQATTLLHECFHIYFTFIGDQKKGNAANAHCYEQFVMDLNVRNGKPLPVPAKFVSSCP